MADADETPQGEEGSFTFAVLIWLLIFLVMMGLIIDGSMEISAQEDAANIADSIARNVANDVNTNDLRSNGTVTIVNDNGKCLKNDVTEITDALNGTAGNLPVNSFTCTVAGDSVTVTVTVDYSPLLGGKNVPATAKAIATAVTAPTK